MTQGTPAEGGLGVEAEATRRDDANLRRRAVLIAAAAAPLGAGCGTAPIGSPADWTLVPMPDAEVPPRIDAAVQGRRTRVVVLEPPEPASARGAGLPAATLAALETTLAAGGVEIVDRRLAQRLGDELKLAEIRAATPPDGPGVADFAINVRIGPFQYSSVFIEASTSKDSAGKVQTTPASHTHTAKGEITLSIHELPSLRLVESMTAHGSCFRSGQRRPPSLAEAQPLMRLAAEYAIDNWKAELLNEFMPQGHVTERRINGKGLSIFRVTLGRHSGARPGDKVQLFTLQKHMNPLTGREAHDRIAVAEGRLSEVVGATESWVVVSETAAAARVRRGDIARVWHEKTFFSRFV